MSDDDWTKNTRLVPAVRSIWELGAEYDARTKGPKRHISIYLRAGFFELAWETTELDSCRLHALHRDEFVARAMLTRRIEDAIRK